MDSLPLGHLGRLAYISDSFPGNAISIRMTQEAFIKRHLLEPHYGLLYSEFKVIGVSREGSLDNPALLLASPDGY